MNNQILLIAVMAIAFTIPAQAQVKRQFIDQKNSRTTVVIKEKNQQDDLAILNEQFDMDEIGMGEVIRITTETVKTPAPKAKPAVAKPKLVKPANKGTAPRAKTVQRKSKKRRAVKPAPVPKPPVKQKHYDWRGKADKTKMYGHKKRFKKKKRKRVRRSRRSCYQF